MDGIKEEVEQSVEQKLSGWLLYKFNQAFSAKQATMKEWDTYWDAYNGIYSSTTQRPDYKTDAVSNYIFSTLETVRPIMLDGRPRFEVIPTMESAREKANTINFALGGEFDREKANKKIETQLITYLVTGNMFFYQPYDMNKKEIKLIPVNPYNIFTDPMATSIDDSEFLIHANYVNVNVLKRMFPAKAGDIYGGDVQYGELAPVRADNQGQTVDNQVLVVEMWSKPSADVNDHVSKKDYKLRHTIGAPELGLIFTDSKSEYDDGKIPMTHFKCYDVPFKMWADGLVKRLISPQKQLNDLNNAIIDNAKHTANVPWIVDKNAGIPRGSITDRPGLIIRKNPGSEVTRPQPPSMPAYVQNKVLEFKDDIEQISGVFDTLKGNSEQGVYTAQGILALQEAGQARIRLLVRALEDGMGDMAQTWLNRMKQFWKEDKAISVIGDSGKAEFITVSNEDLKYDYTIRIKSGSTMPLNKGAMFDLMIRLAQTPAEDGMPMVDRQAVLEYMPGFDKGGILDRMTAYKEEAKQDQMNEQEHLQKHEEISSILQELVKEIQAMNGELTEMRGEYEGSKETEQLDKLKEDAYNSGYSDGEGGMQATQAVETGVQDGMIPEELLSQISELSDAELQELLLQQPELESIINSQLQIGGASV